MKRNNYFLLLVLLFLFFGGKLNAQLNAEVPQGISPNGDGLNDNWILDNLANQTGIAIVEIFDRRGVKVYEKKDYTHEFEGKNEKGNELPAASYFYVIKLKDDQRLTGWLYLAR